MRLPPGLAVALILAMALAGCLGGEKDDAPANGDDQDVVTPPGRGEIYGRVVTLDDLMPVVGGLVRLVKDGAAVGESRTDERGDYTLRDIEPGAYRLQVTGTCCRDHVRQIDVQAGEPMLVNVGLERLPVSIERKPYVDTSGEWEGFINCGVAAGGNPPIYPAACQEGGHSTRKIEFLAPGVRSITFHLEWNTASEGFGAEEFQLTAHNLNAKFALIGEVQGSSPLELTIQNLGLPDEARFDLFDEAGWVGRFAVTPVSDEANVVYQQRFTLRYHIHYWDQAPADYSASPTAGSAGGAEETPLAWLQQAKAQDEHGPNEYQEGPNGDCLDYNVLYLIGQNSPLAQIVEIESGTGYVIDATGGYAFVDFFDEDGEWITWSNYRNWGNVPNDAAYAVLCVTILGDYPDVPEAFASWFYMDGFPEFTFE
jgi:hypothetical protein